ncbi:MAG TPA: branched-chain amino acid ABC transporter permease [Anaerolineae bacterium]|nr:branched-chain amino acid ABC transporter permease [Anaerolineae bacterium]HID85045.1 branched-chain amino acid ABC transporter permease [Anaerolineales bacterium]HIQ08844.1 branched-chain amino acid ABC transporter permease [Anaerolineaceae bacterium]
MNTFRKTRLWIITGAGVGILLLFLFPLPFLSKPYTLYIASQALFYAILASSWALLAGYNGQFSFAHMAFMGLATYASGILGKETGFMAFNLSPWISIPLGVLFTGLVGWVIGYLCLRMRGAYLALFTIAFSEIVRLVIKAEVDITGGPNGMYLKPLFNTTSYLPVYYTMAVVFLGSLAFMLALVRSRYGLYFRAVREDEDAAAALGVNVVNTRVLAFVVSSMIAGLAGAVFHHFSAVGLIVPDEMIIGRMSLVLAMAIIGGSNNLVAAAIGAIFIHFSLEWLQEIPLPAGMMQALSAHVDTLQALGMGLGEHGLKTNAWRMVAFGVLLMVTLRFWRNGLIAPVLERITRREALAEIAARRQALDTEGLAASEEQTEGTP